MNLVLHYLNNRLFIVIMLGITYLYVDPIFHFWMKHIVIDFHSVRDKVTIGELRISHLSSFDQLADTN